MNFNGTARKVMKGIRYFCCDVCGKKWEEKCRDYQTMSVSSCEDCECVVTPYDAKPDPENED